MIAPDEPQMIQLMPLRHDLTDMHFSQLFFVVGHIAIKMLSYVEVLEQELKLTLSSNLNRKKDDKKDAMEDSKK